MDSPNRNRIALIGGGAVVALVAGVSIAWMLTASHRGEPTPPPPASQGGLVIDPSAQPEGKVASTKPLRCFVAGQFVGEFTLAECAQRNGVATDALDVGVDQTGALAAAQQGGAVVTPLPPQEVKPVAQPAPETQSASGPAAACWRYEGTWRKLPADMTLSACAQTLFAGRCEKAGQALYGRWGQQTLRLVPGRIEISSDNRSFRTLSEQGQACPSS
ncbi:hypothetical protein [Phenylobacterium soli]|uniref:Uncharacterized protein n=1 Tax=Phenylobacterium soli TaxID=2170551 RepID=A0A328AQ52_9CAUL|nr:hypothetical protein [Phenylobacterium soli]RAK55614.1 hypothetical protein DJ017_14400 [Phenylobacterium soli]